MPQEIATYVKGPLSLSGWLKSSCCWSVLLQCPLARWPHSFVVQEFERSYCCLEYMNRNLGFVISVTQRLVLVAGQG